MLCNQEVSVRLKEKEKKTEEKENRREAIRRGRGEEELKTYKWASVVSVSDTQIPPYSHPLHTNIKTMTYNSRRRANSWLWTTFLSLYNLSVFLKKEKERKNTLQLLFFLSLCKTIDTPTQHRLSSSQTVCVCDFK